MNNKRRQRLIKINGHLEEAKNDLEIVKEEEQDSFDNMPENLQGGERGQKVEGYIESLEESISDIENAIDKITSAIDD